VTATPALEARNVVKTYGHVEALRGVDFTVHAGEVVALIGDNGAGKSTLTKILSGTTAATSGEVFVDGKPVQLDSPVAARELGIETVYQDLALAASLDTPSNLFLGRELLRPGLLGKLGFLDKKAMRTATDEVYQRFGVDMRNAALPVGSLSGGQRQSVAVARAVAWPSRIVILDEPTAALGVAQTASVLDLVRRVRDAGRAVVLITHNMQQVLEVADRIEVLRLGRRVARFTAADTTVEDLVGAMTAGTDPTAIDSSASGRPSAAPAEGGSR
jgi:simple sugar transport system ATP-binding protein